MTEFTNDRGIGIVASFSIAERETLAEPFKQRSLISDSKFGTVVKIITEGISAAFNSVLVSDQSPEWNDKHPTTFG